MHGGRRAQRENKQAARLIDWGLDGKGGWVLDLGCGTGLALDLRPEIEESYIGIDLSTAMLDVARTKHSEAWLVHDDVHEWLPTQSTGTAGLILGLFGSFSHFLEPAFVLAESFRLLASGGRAVWIGYSPSRLAEHDYTYRENPVPAIAFYPETMRDLCEQAGFTCKVGGLDSRLRQRYVVACCEKP